MHPDGLRSARNEDTNGNGFIDRVRSDDDGDPAARERTVNLLQFGAEAMGRLRG